MIAENAETVKQLKKQLSKDRLLQATVILAIYQYLYMEIYVETNWVIYPSR